MGPLNATYSCMTDIDKFHTKLVYICRAHSGSPQPCNLLFVMLQALTQFTKVEYTQNIVALQ